MEIIIFWLLLAGLVGLFANSRGRSGFGYFLLSAVLSPLLGFIIVLVTPNLVAEERRAEERRRQQERDDFDRQREHEKQIEALKAIASTAKTPTPEVAPQHKPHSAAEEIEKLASLLERGLLSSEEFQQQKAAVLQRQS